MQCMPTTCPASLHESRQNESVHEWFSSLNISINTLLTSVTKCKCLHWILIFAHVSLQKTKYGWCFPSTWNIRYSQTVESSPSKGSKSKVAKTITWPRNANRICFHRISYQMDAYRVPPDIVRIPNGSPRRHPLVTPIEKYWSQTGPVWKYQTNMRNCPVVYCAPPWQSWVGWPSGPSIHAKIDSILGELAVNSVLLIFGPRATLLDHLA